MTGAAPGPAPTPGVPEGGRWAAVGPAGLLPAEVQLADVGGSSATVWVILGGVLLGHVVSLLQGIALPEVYTTADWVLGGALLLAMLGVGALNSLGRAGRRTLVSVIIVSNAAFLLGRLGISLYVVGTSERILTELATLLPWALTVPMLDASMRTAPVARTVATLLPFAMMVMTAAFALTPAGARVQPVVWFGLCQLCLVCLTVMLGARFINGLRSALRRSRADNQALSKLAYVDALTGLHNRAFLDADLEGRLVGGQPFTVLFLDLDGFKAINDSLGHAAGDEVLARLAARLRRLVPPAGALARVSGDEFVLVRPGADLPDVADLARAVVEDLGGPVLVVGWQEVRLSVSVGAARWPADAADPHTLLRRADQAMYAVKRSGKNGFRFYSPHLEDQDMRQSELERDLRHALSRDELRLSFQPLCDLPSGRVVALEALVRWEPSSGAVSPGVFVPIAENCGLIGALGDWVLRGALRAAAQWQLTWPEVRVAVNVSPLQLMQPGFAAGVAQALEDTGVAPAALELEITEGVDLQGHAEVAQAVARLRGLGVGLSLDDFGTGFASLSRLNDVPVQSVKIDRSFVADLALGADMARAHSARILIAAMVAVAATSGLELVAEGVETPEQLNTLLALGCRRAQGHLFSPPVGPAELARLLARGPLLPPATPEV